MSAPPRQLVAMRYEEYARDYLRKLPPEHFMESTAQAWQKLITTACLLLVAAQRADFHVFSELLVQYPRRRKRRPGQVVPDNMVVLTTEPISATTCYNLPLEPAGPFWTLEYVSKSNRRKDYEDNFDKYELYLKVPYFLMFYPETQDLTLYRHTGKKYVSVKPNEQGRYAIPEVEIELALVDGWIRYWYKGEMLPLPTELHQNLRALGYRFDDEKRRADDEKRRADELQRRLSEAEAKLARLLPSSEDSTKSK